MPPGVKVIAVVLAVTGAGAGSCEQPRIAVEPTPAPVTAAATGPGTLRGQPLTGPSGMRLLIKGRIHDVDAGTSGPAGVNNWLRPPSGPTIFVEEIATSDDFGTARVEAATTPIGTAVRLTRPPNAGVAASADGRGIWIVEYRSRTECTVRELWLDGRTRRAARAAPCGIDVLVETAAGLWVSQWVNAYSLTGRTITSSRARDETTFALLDPDTLERRAQYAEARVVGAHHVLTMGDDEQDLVLRDLRTGDSVGVSRPATFSFWGFGTKLVSNVSPDGRYALFRFGEHSSSPYQTLDLWVLDLVTASWLRLPDMPIYAALKYCFEDWTADGRLALVGDFPRVGPRLATWRPGDAQLSVRTHALPAATLAGGLGEVYFW